MEIITKGLFKFDPKKSYVLIDENKVEYGTIEVDGEDVIVHFKEEDKDDEIFSSPLDFEHWLNNKKYIITSDSVRWLNYNPNPKTDKANDCSIRAYCAAENLKWDDAYDIACQYGKLNYMMPNDSKNCANILTEEFGYTYHKLKKEEKGQTVKEFAINHPEGIYVLDLPKHLVAVLNGEYYDSWDSGDKKIKGYYER